MSPARSEQSSSIHPISYSHQLPNGGNLPSRHLPQCPTWQCRSTNMAPVKSHGGVLASEGFLGVREYTFLCPGISLGKTTGPTWTCARSVAGVSPCVPRLGDCGQELGYQCVLLLLPGPDLLSSLSQLCPIPPPPCPIMSCLPQSPVLTHQHHL